MNVLLPKGGLPTIASFMRLLGQSTDGEVGKRSANGFEKFILAAMLLPITVRRAQPNRYGFAAAQGLSGRGRTDKD